MRSTNLLLCKIGIHDWEKGKPILCSQGFSVYIYKKVCLRCCKIKDEIIEYENMYKKTLQKKEERHEHAKMIMEAMAEAQ